MATYKSEYTGSQIDAGIQAAYQALQKSGGTMQGALVLAGNPANDNEAATKKYVDDAVDNIALTPGADGQDGISVTHSWDGTDLRGEQGEPGKPGEPGTAGSDGVSPIITVTAISGGHRITITDVNGTQTFDVMDGEDGSGGSGESGGTGADGKDGYSPIRGIDYWTEEDIATIKAYVDEAILNGSW